MKKFILPLISLLILSSCVYEVTPEEKKNSKSNYVQRHSTIIELTFENKDHVVETHEYVYFNTNDGNTRIGSATHWEGCAYCKEYKKNQNN